MLFRTNRKVVSENEYNYHNYHNYRKYWKKMVDKQSDDIYYKDYRRELYLDIYLVSLRYKKPKATWGWLDY